MALIAVLLLLMTMSGLAAALAINSNTETLIARNHQTAAQARAAAEAGLSHAVALVISDLQDWESTCATLTLAMSGLLASGGCLPEFDDLDTPQLLRDLTGYTTGLPETAVTYEARVLDEDHPDRGLSTADITTILEDNDEESDANEKIVVRAIGNAGGSAIATIEATIAPLELPAIVTEDSLTIVGSVAVGGTTGGVHTNTDMTFSGNAAQVVGECTASGVTTGSPAVGNCSGGAPSVTIPDVQASDYVSKADYTLHTGGTYSIGSGSPVTCANPCLGAWRWESNEWRVTSQGNLTPTDGTYYVETDVTISGSPGSVATPVQMSIIAEGSINISGSPVLTPDSPGLLFVTDEDLSLGGNLTANFAEALMLVREQVGIAGNVAIAGQLMVQNAASVSTLVTTNGINGNVTITYNGSLDGKFVTVSAWRLVP